MLLNVNRCEKLIHQNIKGQFNFQPKAEHILNQKIALACCSFQDVFLLAENVDKDIGELFTFDEMFTKEYQPNDFTAKWIGGKLCFALVAWKFSMRNLKRIQK